LKDCKTCKWNEYLKDGKQAMICLQGHVRRLGGGNVENCHAWEERKECECYYFEHLMIGKGSFNITCKICGRKL